MELDKRELRKFGFTTGAFVVGLFGLLLPWWSGRPLPWWPWIVSGSLWLAAIAVPASLAPIYRAWMVVGQLLGWVNTRVILGVTFYTLFVPVGLFMRLLGKDPMARKWDKGAASYRIGSAIQPKRQMENPF